MILWYCSIASKVNLIFLMRDKDENTHPYKMGASVDTGEMQHCQESSLCCQ
jgi:hypothetical protein